MIYYHWHELKYRFYYYFTAFLLSSIIIWHFKFNILFYITDFNLIYTSLNEAFQQYLYFTLILAFIFNIPLLIYNYILFILPGLYLFEYINIIKKIFKFTIIYFILYYYLFFNLYYIISNFFAQFQSPYLDLNLNIKHFITFFNYFIITFCSLTTLPFINFNLKNKRTIIYFTLLLIIAIITPPDIISLVIIIIPIIILFEINYFINNKLFY